jgi:hypothetical protein
MNTTPINFKDAWLKSQYVLLQITLGFGFNESESGQILQEVKVYMNSQASIIEEMSLRLWLAKKVVRQCVFLVSKDIFMSPPAAGSPGHTFMKNPFIKSYNIHTTGQMGLASWTTYLLVDIIGFNDLEAAIILNVHPFKLREQLSIARGLVA